MITSRLTAKAQTTIPLAVRNALELRPGDGIGYRIEEPGKRVVLVRVPLAGAAAEDPFAVFGEWDSAADTRAYGGL